VNGHSFSSFYKWKEQFCIMGEYGSQNILGYKNIPILKNLLQNNMLRRLTSEVLDLPPIIYYNEYVENTPCQDALYQAICEELYKDKENIISSLNPLTAMLRLRQVNGSPELVDASIQLDEKYLSKNAKLAWLVERIDDIVSNDEKVIVFSNWVQPLRTIYKYIKQKHKICCYMGTMSEEDREKHKRVFINNPNYKVMLGTIGSIGESVTLTVAENIIFYDDCWTYADKMQCIKRANRIGSTKPLKVVTLMSKDTIDERVRQIIDTKQGIAGYIVDDNIDLRQNPQLFDFLLGRENV
jgi:SNF2 family DNA or RNA helicase